MAQAAPAACCMNGHPDHGLDVVLSPGQNGKTETAGQCNDTALFLQVDPLSLRSLFQIQTGGQAFVNGDRARARSEWLVAF